MDNHRIKVLEPIRGVYVKNKHFNMQIYSMLSLGKKPNNTEENLQP